ncbi:disease resistance protein [Populus alba x Populus x berolinensis]|nr:disease resistance protein [Populus alba x Populus x berolinensis]
MCMQILFPNLEDLKLTSIKVEKIWPDQPAVQPPCVRNLASIAVESCSNLNYLLTSSMVESLAQLERLEIRNCESMEEIVVPEGIGEGKMLFPKLLRLKLNGLPKLTRFCTTNLLECHFLKELEIWKCPELKEFISTPSSAMSKPDNTKSALFDDKVAFPELEVFEISGMDNLRVIWHSELHSDSFCKLKTLQVRSGKNLLNIFPSTTQLRVVRLWNLPHLKHVWNRDPQGILSFHNLCTVDVRECPGLRSLFPASIALNLPQLEELLITTCGVEEIVAKDEGLEEGPEFLFPKVTGLHLRKLPELKRFYPGIHTSEWPRLKTLRVYDCEKIEIFPSEKKCSHEPCREDHMDIEVAVELIQHSITSDDVSCHSFSIVGWIFWDLGEFNSLVLQSVPLVSVAMQQAKLFLTVYGFCALADSAEFNRLVLQSGPLDSVVSQVVLLFL